MYSIPHRVLLSKTDHLNIYCKLLISNTVESRAFLAPPRKAKSGSRNREFEKSGVELQKIFPREMNCGSRDWEV